MGGDQEDARFVEKRSIRQIHRLTGYHRATIRAALESGEPPRYERPTRPSKLDPLKDGGRDPSSRRGSTEGFAAFCGFLPVGRIILDARDPEAKGALERAHRFMRTNFEPARGFANELDYQAQLDARTEKANARKHRATRAVLPDRLVCERARSGSHLFRSLKAPAAARAVPGLAERAREKEWSHERFLEVVLSSEVASRQSHGGESRIRSARFPARKTLEEFDFSFQRSVRKPVVEHLGQLDFLHGKENVVMLGPRGTGKTHLAIALGIRACPAQAGGWRLRPRPSGSQSSARQSARLARGRAHPPRPGATARGGSHPIVAQPARIRLLRLVHGSPPPADSIVWGGPL